ncbi:protein translocase SEC61 complex subunit gamma [Candidatus Woesearchaeota archaeon ex4484_78]|nr:MAG: protein translocase SEC61 complex subunit gamma [Candidatus Woesearchaeota archaeon ex4484_78]
MKAKKREEKQRLKEEKKRRKEEAKARKEPQETKLFKLKRFIKECRRVLKVTKKPDKQEFLTIVKVSALGMAIIGIIGFLIHMIKELLL